MSGPDLVVVLGFLVVLVVVRGAVAWLRVLAQPRDRDPQPPRQLDDLTEARRRRAAAWDQPAAKFIESRRDDDRRAHLTYLHHKRP